MVMLMTNVKPKKLGAPRATFPTQNAAYFIIELRRVALLRSERLVEREGRSNLRYLDQRICKDPELLPGK